MLSVQSSAVRSCLLLCLDFYCYSFNLQIVAEDSSFCLLQEFLTSRIQRSTWLRCFSSLDSQLSRPPASFNSFLRELSQRCLLFSLFLHYSNPRSVCLLFLIQPLDFSSNLCSLSTISMVLLFYLFTLVLSINLQQIISSPSNFSLSFLRSAQYLTVCSAIFFLSSFFSLISCITFLRMASRFSSSSHTFCERASSELAEWKILLSGSEWLDEILFFLREIISSSFCLVISICCMSFWWISLSFCCRKRISSSCWQLWLKLLSLIFQLLIIINLLPEEPTVSRKKRQL